MKNYFNKINLLSLILCLGFVFTQAIEAQNNKAKKGKTISHSVFIAGPQFTGIIDEQGEVVWDSGRKGARDGYVLPNGNVLICWGDEVKEFDKAKNVLFTFKKELKERLNWVLRFV